MNKLRYFVNLVVVLMLLITVAINRDGKLFGKKIEEWKTSDRQETGAKVIRTDDQGYVVINTTTLSKGISGYAGPTPVEIYLKEGKIVKVVALENSETPRFFNRVLETGILNKWNGLKPEEASAVSVDAVSGATFSSKSLINNVQLGIAYAAQNTGTVNAEKWFSLKNIAALLVIILGLLAAFFNKSKKLRYVILVLNFIVLGFWCGSFISLSLLVGWVSNGINLPLALIPVALCTAAAIIPFLGRKGHYCAWHCPMGSLQEILGKSIKPKVSISQKVLRYLNYTGDFILGIMLLLMWVGVAFQVMDYEIFSAFLFKQADVVVIALAVAFLILSCFVNRPYCRFVCPTGTLLRWSNKTKHT